MKTSRPRKFSNKEIERLNNRLTREATVLSEREITYDILAIAAAISYNVLFILLSDLIEFEDLINSQTGTLRRVTP